MNAMLLCAMLAGPAFTWTQGLGNGWAIRKFVMMTDAGVVIAANLVPSTQITPPLGIETTGEYEFVEGVVRDFNANGVADSETRYTFKVRQTVIVVLPVDQSPGVHPFGKVRQAATGQHHVIIEFLDEHGCVYGRPEDLEHDADGKLVIDWRQPLCFADR